MKHINKRTVEEAQYAAEQAKAEADHAAWQAKRAALLLGTYCVGADAYSADYWERSKRPPIELSYQPHKLLCLPIHQWSEIGRLPNGDWIEYDGNSWRRHTYDAVYALDCARRQQIGGYVLRAEAAAACRAVIEAGAAQMAGWVIWQYYEFADGRCSVANCSGMRALRADEQAQRWAKCLCEARDRHPEHVGIINQAIDALMIPDAVREYPASLDGKLNATIRELERVVEES